MASLGRAVHLQLCSVRIPQAKEDVLHAITLLARNHTPELVATFLDFSIPLDRCPAPRSPLPPRPPSASPRQGAGLPPLPSCRPPPGPRGPPQVRAQGRSPRPVHGLQVSRGRPWGGAAPHSSPLPASFPSPHRESAQDPRCPRGRPQPTPKCCPPSCSSKDLSSLPCLQGPHSPFRWGRLSQEALRPLASGHGLGSSSPPESQF